MVEWGQGETGRAEFESARGLLASLFVASDRFGAASASVSQRVFGTESDWTHRGFPVRGWFLGWLREVAKGERATERRMKAVKETGLMGQIMRGTVIKATGRFQRFRKKENSSFLLSLKIRMIKL
ncbi:unnamed protein product [Arctogadus glacialis]